MPRKAKTEEPVVTEDSLAPQTDGTGTALENTPEPETSPASPPPNRIRPKPFPNRMQVWRQRHLLMPLSRQERQLLLFRNLKQLLLRHPARHLPHPRLPHLLTQNDRSLPPSLP